MRSVAGCQTCRRRKLKCDEKRPECGQCRKAARTCVPAELVFRHQQNSSVGRERSNALKGYYSQRSSFDDSNTWLEIPKQVTFVNENAQGYGATGAETEADAAQESPPAEASSPALQRSNQAWEAANGLPNSPAAFSPVSASSANSAYGAETGMLRTESLSFRGLDRPPNNIDFILNPVSAGMNLGVGGYQAAGTPETYVGSPQSQPSRASRASKAQPPVESSPEVAFLLRHYSEKPGKWLDLYFLDAYFGLDVPMKALSHPLLKYSACAYAAKHLSRTTRSSEAQPALAPASQLASSVVWPGSATVDWAWYGAKYYSQAINLLRETLQHTHDLDVAPNQHSPDPGSFQQETLQPDSYAEISDETLAAMAILCNFEYMSASDSEWTRHLSGTMLILDLKHTGVMQSSTSRPSKARKAIFWNFFRQDVFAAFILEGRTRLDPDDLRIWRTAGLILDEDGCVLPSNTWSEDVMRDDMVSNALIWILSKVVNFIASIKDSRQQASSSTQDLAQGNLPVAPSALQALEEKWKTIIEELQVWHDGLSHSFQPCARLERAATEPSTALTPIKPASIPEIWFTSPMCASTMQTYHLARILLLVNKPHANNMAFRTGAVSDFLHFYRNIEAELTYRCREIFGIALASRSSSIYLHQTQTIFIAGQCLVDNDERRMAIDILRRVNTDLGWETEYRVQQLLKEWGWKEPRRSE